MADREVALERGERGLVEDLRDQAHVLVDQDLAAVAHRDAGGLLAAVLEGVEAEVGQLGDVLARRPDAEDAAGVLRALVVGVECCGQPTVATRARPAGLVHGAESTGASGSCADSASRCCRTRPEIAVTHVTWAPPRGKGTATPCLGKPTTSSRRPTDLVRRAFSRRPPADRRGRHRPRRLRRRRDQRGPRGRQARGDGRRGQRRGPDRAPGPAYPRRPADDGDREGRRLGPARGSSRTSASTRAPARPGAGSPTSRRSTTPTPGTRSTC